MSIPNKKAPARGAFLFGTPDWIRTSGLQSRSLTRYPTALRALSLIHYTTLLKKSNNFLQTEFSLKGVPSGNDLWFLFPFHQLLHGGGRLCAMVDYLIDGGNDGHVNLIILC